MSAANFVSRRVLAVALAASALRCVDLPQLSEFACERGGPCVDAGVEEAPLTDAMPMDASSPDAALDGGDVPPGPDSGAPDSGVPDVETPASCGSSVLFVPASGRAEGVVSPGDPNNFTSRCGGQNGPEHIYRLDIPFTVDRLIARMLPDPDEYDTVLSLFGGTCDPADELTCNDDGDVGLLSELQLDRVPSGPYFLSVDAYAGAGRYRLEVIAMASLGDRCDPERPFIYCDRGACALDGDEYRCLPRNDCSDGYDGDDDGQIDEDAPCTSAPVITCPGPIEVRADQPNVVVPLAVSVSEPARFTAFDWLVRRDGPPSNLVTNRLSATVATTLVGEYDLHITGVDLDRNAVTCEIPVRLLPAGELHIELNAFYSTPALSLVLISPQATNWAQRGQVCLSTACDRLDWGAAGTADNPSGFQHWTLTRHQAIWIPAPERGGTYSIGVQLHDPRYSADPMVRVFCGGQTVELGPVNLPKAPSAGEALFWKVADVSFSGTSCTVTPLGTPGAPVLVRYMEATTTR